MKKIIFPTNFSSRTDTVFSYATHFCQYMDTEIVVYHATTKDHVDGVGKPTKDFVSGEDTFTFFDGVLERLSIDPSRVTYVLEEGEFRDIFQDFVVQHGDDLIIMGTEGKDSVYDYFWNTNTIDLFKKTETNLLAVPKTVKSQGDLTRIVYMTNYNLEEDQASLAKIQNTLNGHEYRIDVLHFDIAHTEMYTHNMERLKSSIELPNKDLVVFKSIDTVDILDSLKQFKQENNIDMVAITSRFRSHYERIFFNSLTENLINELKVPVLSLYA